MESELGRFKVAPAPAEERVVGRFRLIQVIFHIYVLFMVNKNVSCTSSQPGGSPFLQRGRFSVIPEEGQEGSPQTQTKLSGPKIVVESTEWDFVSKHHYYRRYTCSVGSILTEILLILLCDKLFNTRKP